MNEEKMSVNETENFLVKQDEKVIVIGEDGTFQRPMAMQQSKPVSAIIDERGEYFE